MKNFCTFYIVRHGETEWNVKGLIQGQVKESKLTDEGIKQSKLLKEKLKHLKFDAVYTSDSKRTRKTAQLIASIKQREIITTPLLRERSFGKYEGKHNTLLKKELGHLFKIFEELSDEKKKVYKFPELESDHQMSNRIGSFLTQTYSQHHNKNVLVITHSGLMRVLLLNLSYSTYSKLSFNAIKNTAYIKLLFNCFEFKIEEISGITI